MVHVPQSRAKEVWRPQGVVNKESTLIPRSSRSGLVFEGTPTTDSGVVDLYWLTPINCASKWFGGVWKSKTR